uniref:Protein krueppel n=1 Tax=Anopheles farauti TaxID=69004 RepID=A0A182QMN4_9DIPT
MANGTQKMIVICRLCLSQDERLLRPVTETIDASLTILEIKRFSGIPININEEIAYAICFECADRVQSSIAFRNACLDNDGLFQELRSAFMAQLGCTEKDAVVIVDDSISNRLGQQYFQIDDDNNVHIENLTTDPYKEDVSIEQAEAVIVFDRVESDPVSDEYDAADNVRLPGQTTESSDLSVTTEESTKPSHSNREIRSMRTEKSSRTKKLCTICGKMVTSLPSHIAQHTNEPTQHACPYCPVKMTVKSNLKQHIQAVHLKKISKKCKLCDKGFTQNKSYASHMISFHGIGRKHPCKLCSRVFNFPSGLKDHMNRVHSEVRSLECDICGKMFKVKSALATHIRTHSGDQPYACTQCPKRFKSQFAKKTHELTHSGIVFECGFCSKTYRYKALLSMHLRKTHSTEMLESTEYDEEQEVDASKEET